MQRLPSLPAICTNCHIRYDRQKVGFHPPQSLLHSEFDHCSPGCYLTTVKFSNEIPVYEATKVLVAEICHDNHVRARQFIPEDPNFNLREYLGAELYDQLVSSQSDMFLTKHT